MLKAHTDGCVYMPDIQHLARRLTLAKMNDNSLDNNNPTQWYAIRTRQDFRAEKALASLCEQVFFPKETVTLTNHKKREKAIIPHVLFIKTTREHALALEAEGRQHPGASIPFWIYRYPASNEIQVIPQKAIALLRLLTADDTTRCEIFSKKDFKENQRVRITGGVYQGYEGFVQRVKKNKHVVVRIEGICMVMLPYIHPDMLENVI